jgi:hypothetical protein
MAIMYLTSGLLTSVFQRLGTPTLIMLALVVGIAATLALITVVELIAAAVDPIQVAPVRWTYHT